MAYKKLKYWFDKKLAEMLAGRIQPHFKKFDEKRFVKAVDRGTRDLELKDRVELIADLLKEQLPDDFTEALAVLMKSLGPENEQETGMFTEYYWIMPIAKFVEKYGLDHFRASMDAIAEITKRNTGEYCIRPFLDRYPEKTLAVMKKWARHRNVHLRRLASEGLRPRLPWARKMERFIRDPGPVLDIIVLLRDDESKFVQKSVANNLNDILKDNPDMGLKTIQDWTRGATQNRKWIIRHALRNLIKKQDPAAREIMNLIG